MSTMIPLMGKQPDVVNALAGGARAAGVANQVQHSNRLRDLYANQGAGILAGDPSAMNALAGLDPAQAHTMQMDRQNQQRADARLAISQEQLQMQRNAVARALAQAEDQAEAQREAQEAVMMGNKAMAALQAGDERAWSMMTSEFTDGTPLPMTREGVATLQSIVTGSADYMATMPEPYKAQSQAGKTQQDIDAGVLSSNVPLTSPSVVVNTGNQIDPRPLTDKPPKGFQRRYDPERGTWVDEAIPGSDPAADRAGAAEKSDLASARLGRKYGIVDSALDRSIAMVEDRGRWVTGVGNTLLSGLPETDARSLQAEIDLIKANLGFEELQEMRDSSPTGGALGQVTERELAFLQSVTANLDLARSSSDVLRTLRDLKEGRARFAAERARITGEAAPAPQAEWTDIGDGYRIRSKQ